MALGSPALSSAPGSAWQRGEEFGVQPSGPIPRVGGAGLHTLGAGGEKVVPTSASRGMTSALGARLQGKAFGSYAPSGATGARGGGALPGAGALDYAHKLTQTTILLAAVVAFLIYHRRDPRKGLRHLAARHVGEV